MCTVTWRIRSTAIYLLREISYSFAHCTALICGITTGTVLVPWLTLQQWMPQCFNPGTSIATALKAFSSLDVSWNDYSQCSIYKLQAMIRLPMVSTCGTMMTSSNGNIFRVTGPLWGEFTGPGEFPTQRPVTRSFDVFSDLRLNKRLSKQPSGWWFETPSWSLWCQCNVCGGANVMVLYKDIWLHVAVDLFHYMKTTMEPAEFTSMIYLKLGYEPIITSHNMYGISLELSYVCRCVYVNPPYMQLSWQWCKRTFYLQRNPNSDQLIYPRGGGGSNVILGGKPNVIIRGLTCILATNYTWPPAGALLTAKHSLSVGYL